MAEENVIYASVVFKPVKGLPRQGLLPAQKSAHGHHHYQQLTCCLGILCVILLLSIAALCFYFTLKHHSDASELKQLNFHQTTLTADIRNLTQNYTVLARNFTDLTAENGQLQAQNQNLSAENQELQTQRKKLKEQIQNMETRWNELNISRAQWAIDNYCPKQNSTRQCKACQTDWLTFQSSCYTFNNAAPPDLRSWEGARDDCRGKNSDLAVIVNEDEKKFITDNSWNAHGINGYWIGLSAENGRWRWINGSYLAESSWIQEPAANNTCATPLLGREWKPMSCNVNNAWICKKQALSV